MHVVKHYSIHGYRRINILHLVFDFLGIWRVVLSRSELDPFLYIHVNGIIQFGPNTGLAPVIQTYEYVVSSKNAVKFQIIFSSSEKKETNVIPGTQLKYDHDHI